MNDNYENSPFFIYAETILNNKSGILTDGASSMWHNRIENAIIAIHDAIMCTKHYHLPEISLNTYYDMLSLDFLLSIARNENIQSEHKENILGYVLSIPGVDPDNVHNQVNKEVSIEQHAYATMIIFKNTRQEWDTIVAITERDKLSQIAEKNIFAENKKTERI